MSELEIDEIYEIVSGERYDWSNECCSTVCAAVSDLVELGIEREKAIEIVRVVFWASANEFGA